MWFWNSPPSKTHDSRSTSFRSWCWIKSFEHVGGGRIWVIIWAYKHRLYPLETSSVERNWIRGEYSFPFLQLTVFTFEAGFQIPNQSYEVIINLSYCSFAAIASSSVTAVPAPGPFERDIDIYSRAHPDYHEAAADIHLHAAHISQVAADRAKKIGWNELAAFHEMAAERNLEHAHLHTWARITGTGAYDLSSLHVAKSAIETAHKTIAKVEHAEAAALNLAVSHYAHQLGWHDLANGHMDVANRNHGYLHGDIQYPEYAKASKVLAHRTISLQPFRARHG